MARIRSVKPEFFSNEDLAELSAHTRLLFIGLWTLADRRGILEDRPKRIKASLFPYESVPVEKLLTELESRRFIHRYHVGEIRAILIPTFGKHQNPHVNEKSNDIPEPDQHYTSTVQEPEQHESETVQVEKCISPIVSCSLSTVNGSLSTDLSLSPDGEVRAKRGPSYAPAFEEFWAAYPTGHGIKKTAHSHWQKLSPDERARLPAALDRWKACERWQEGYVKDCERWIRDRLWEQEPPTPKPRNPIPIHRNGKPDFHARAALLRAQQQNDVIDTTGVTHESRRSN